MKQIVAAAQRCVAQSRCTAEIGRNVTNQVSQVVAASRVMLQHACGNTLLAPSSDAHLQKHSIIAVVPPHRSSGRHASHAPQALAEATWPTQNLVMFGVLAFADNCMRPLRCNLLSTRSNNALDRLKGLWGHQPLPIVCPLSSRNFRLGQPPSCHWLLG